MYMRIIPIAYMPAHMCALGRFKSGFSSWACVYLKIVQWPGPAAGHILQSAQMARIDPCNSSPGCLDAAIDTSSSTDQPTCTTSFPESSHARNCMSLPHRRRYKEPTWKNTEVDFTFSERDLLLKTYYAGSVPMHAASSSDSPPS